MDIQGSTDIMRDVRCILRLILEKAYLSDEQIIIGCRKARQAGANCVKTTTGFDPSGATDSGVWLMRVTVESSMNARAAWGPARVVDAMRTLRSDSDRLGTGEPTAILAEAASYMD